jgi:type 1 glutamine amidotransferase
MFRSVIAFMLLAAVGGAAETSPTAKAIRVLIVTGNEYPGHKWRETTPAIRSALEQAGRRFDVKVCEDPEIMSTRLADRYDVAILHYCNWQSPSPSRAALDGLADFVRSGKGLIAVHFAIGAFQDWPEYVRLIGRVWDTTKTHDPLGSFRIHVVKKGHPITRGLEDFDITDELYFCLKGETPMEVLLTARSKVTKQDEPMGFVLTYGKGRVFHTPLGHDVRAFTNPGVVRLLQNACEWVAPQSHEPRGN